MTKPTLEVFAKATREALANVDVPQAELQLLDAKGPPFNLYDDGGVDSLDMLDIAFYIEKDLGIKLEIERLMHGDDPMTLQNLFNAIRQNENPSA